jgi:pentatricopeptide repeat protein
MRSVARTLRAPISIKSIAYSTKTRKNSLQGNPDSKTHRFQVQATSCITLSKKNLSEGRIPEKTPNVACENSDKHPRRASEGLKRRNNRGFKKHSQKADNILFTSLVQEGFRAEAKEIYAKMLENGMNPNVPTLDSFIIGLCDQQKAEDAAFLLENMEIRGIFPSWACCIALIRELCRAMQGFVRLIE